MSWILHHTYVKWGWQRSNCNISKRMIAFSSFHCPSVFLSCSQPMVPNVFLFPCIYAPFMYLSLPFMFISCAFDFYVLSLKKTKRFRQPYLCFTVLLMFLWFLFFRSSPFLSDLPFMSLSFYSLVTSVSFLLSFKSFHFSYYCMFYHFFKSSRISAHVRFKLCSWSLVLFMIFPCWFMHRGANSLCDNVQQF